MLDLDDLEDEQLQLPSVKVQDKELDKGVASEWMSDKGVTTACSESAVRVTSVSTLAGDRRQGFRFKEDGEKTKRKATSSRTKKTQKEMRSPRNKRRRMEGRKKGLQQKKLCAEVCDSAWWCAYRARRRRLGRRVASGSKPSGETRLRSKGKAAAAALQAGAMLSAKSRAAKWRVLARTWSLLPSSMQASMRPLMRASLRAVGFWRQVAVAEERKVNEV